MKMSCHYTRVEWKICLRPCTMKTNKKMIEMVSTKGHNFRFRYYCKRKKKKPRLHYAKLTISTVIRKDIYKDRKHHYEYTLHEHIPHFKIFIYACSGYKKIKVTASPISADIWFALIRELAYEYCELGTLKIELAKCSLKSYIVLIGSLATYLSCIYQKYL